MVETSHWFREFGDPSNYDLAKEFFNNPSIPLEAQIDSSKVLMRIYFFIVPYIASAICLVLVHALPKCLNVSDSLARPSIQSRLLLSSLRFPKSLVGMGAPDSISVGELIGVTVFLLLNLMTLGVRVRRSLPRGTRKNLYLVDDGDEGKRDIPAFSWPALEVWGKTLGVIAIINLGWYLLMPVGRKSVLLEALGVSWDRAIKYHRWVGFYTTFVMILHGLFYILVLIHGNGHPVYDPDGVMLKHNLFAWGCRSDDDSDSEDEDECDVDQKLLLRINMYGITSLVLVVVMTIFALPYFRRKLFEWFYYIHHLFILVLFFVCLHYKGAILYLIPGVAIYTIDKLMGIYAYKNCCIAKTDMVSSDVLECSFKVDTSRYKYKAGQYVFVNVPSVSHLQWHPYSLTSSPNANPGEIFFHLKESGDSENSWTRKVVEVGREGQLEMRIDAFYGDYSDELSHKKAVVLVGGGIGITPMISLGMDLIATDRNLPVTILWVCRTVQEFEIFSEMLCKAKRQHPNLTAKVWITLSVAEDKISKQDVNKLETEQEKCDLVLSLFKPTTTLQKDKEKLSDTDEAKNHLFRKATPGLEPLGNAVAMTIAMIFALTGYAASVNFSRDQGIEGQHAKTLIDMGIVMGMILVVFVVLVVVRPLLFEAKKNTEGVVDRTNSNSSTDKDEEELSDSENVEFGSRVRHADVYRSMLQGRIGCRPDMKAEFHELANRHKRDTNENFDMVGVLACGPKAMTNAIADAVHNTGALNSFFDAGKIQNEDGTDATFAFVEEDWEW
eukprot:CAMPEP_0116136866 /NCGR_PEP_ID=MMETSP0329-20121206/11957_1 /TAXON_ID=697910 /ORGANISM="Pseudo-nitzschia arenysensis, Strain B593" /LENGTH=780 /DNA_ID=CAMNT_0003631771 /DNA_START=281 /DNA_END=2623 /DNA_ORIENTATION=+